jgi:hypothetical protein
VNFSDGLRAVITVGSLLSVLGTIATFYWSNVRLPARRLGVFDLAIKQIAFWDQALKLELLATTDERVQRDARDRAYAAVQRIRSHADRELEYLSWSEKTNQLIFQSRKSLLTMGPPRSLMAPDRFSWWCYKIFCSITLLLTVPFLWLFCAAVFAPHLRDRSAVELSLGTLIVLAILLARSFACKPETPILNEL